MKVRSSNVIQKACMIESPRMLSKKIMTSYRKPKKQKIKQKNMYELLSVANSSNIGKEHARAAEWALAASWLVKALVF